MTHMKEGRLTRIQTCLKGLSGHKSDSHLGMTSAEVQDLVFID